MGIWTIASIICLVAAGLFLLRGNFDAAFVMAVLGSVSWMLNYRSKIRETLPDGARTTIDEANPSDGDEDEE